jgi:hypothetical protein
MPLSLVTVRDAPGHVYAGTPRGHIWHSADYGDSWQRLPFKMAGIRSSMVVL